MKLHYHPVSSFSQKALVGLHEKQAEFTPVVLSVLDPQQRAAFRALNPYGKIPALQLDDGSVIIESTIILDYVDSLLATGTRLIPADPDAAREVRRLDRIFDLYVNDPMGTIFFSGRKPPSEHVEKEVAAARALLDTSYRLLEETMATRTWAAGDAFTLADCAACPALNYASFCHPFKDHPNLTAYHARLRERPSFKRVLDEAAPALQAIFGVTM